MLTMILYLSSLIKDGFLHVLSILVMANVTTSLWKLVNSTIPYHDVTSTVKPLSSL